MNSLILSIKIMNGSVIVATYNLKINLDIDVKNVDLTYANNV
jgi:hypothetical protein